MQWTAAHVRVLVCGDVSDGWDLKTGGHKEGDNGHRRYAEQTNKN